MASFEAMGLPRWGIALLVLVAACASRKTYTPQPIRLDVSLLDKVDTNKVGLAYVRRDLDLSRYKAVWVEWPRLDYLRDPSMASIPREQIEALRQFFVRRVTEELGSEYRVVTGPGDQPVLRFRTTITGLKTSEFGVGSGYAAIEGDYRDGDTGRLLLAFADKRGGGQLIPGLEKLSDAQGALDYWARLIRQHLDLMRAEGRGIF
jgi:hypothetical protein